MKTKCILLMLMLALCPLPAGAQGSPTPTPAPALPIGRSTSIAAVFDGDSLTAEDVSSYPRQLQALRNWKSYTNFAVSGQTIQMMLADATTQIDPYIGQTSGLLIAWGGTNDVMSGADATTVYNGIVAYASGRKAAGYRVIVLTMIARGYFTPAMEQQRLQINTWLRQNWPNYAAALVDVASDPRLSNPTNQTYFAGDQTHLTYAGYSVVAALVGAAL